MTLQHHLAPVAGPHLAASRRALTIPAQHGAALAFAAQLDRRADLLLAEGRCRQAERLAHLALEARCRAREGSL